MVKQVSVIIISKNEPKIKYTLESLAFQTIKPNEVLVVVDNPNDTSAEIAQSFKGKLPIRVINNSIPGVGGARASGIEYATGDIIIFIDSDELAPPWWISRIIKRLEAGEVVVAGPAIEVKINKISNFLKDLTKFSEPEFNSIRYIDFAPTENFAFTREVVNSVGNFDTEFDIGGEDYDFCIRLGKAGFKIAFDEGLYVFHMGSKYTFKRIWRNGKARARVFLKHGRHAIRDAFVIFFHSLSIVSLPIAVVLIMYKSILALPLLILVILSAIHRLYRAYLTWKQGFNLVRAIVRSFKVYISYIAFIKELLHDFSQKHLKRAKDDNYTSI